MTKGIAEKDWITTDHPRVFYESKGDKYIRGELERAKVVASAFEEWKILITMGPWRGYDVAYRTNRVKKIINLDFYSVRMCTSDHIISICHEIQAFLNGVEVGKKDPIKVKKATLFWEVEDEGIEEEQCFEVGEVKVVGETMHIAWTLKGIEVSQ